jgi:hypothetical protein
MAIRIASFLLIVLVCAARSLTATAQAVNGTCGDLVVRLVMNEGYLTEHKVSCSKGRNYLLSNHNCTSPFVQFVLFYSLLSPRTARMTTLSGWKVQSPRRLPNKAPATSAAAPHNEDEDSRFVLLFVDT